MEPKPILRLEIGKPRRSSGGSVEFQKDPDVFESSYGSPSPQPSSDRLFVSWGPPHCVDSSGTSLFRPIECSSPISAFKMEQTFPATADLELSEDEDYSASVTAILQRRASSRSRRGRSLKRRTSSPFISPGDDIQTADAKRRASVYTTSSGDTAISVEEGCPQEVTQDQIFENIRLHKEVLGSVKIQPWHMRRKLRLVHQAKSYIAKHEGALQERLAMSRNTKDILARFNILIATKLQHFRREMANLSNWLIPWERRIKEIESHFGSVVASYFTFLRWLFWVNLVIAVVLILFVIVPEVLIADPKEAGDRKVLHPEEVEDAQNLFTLWDFKGALKYTPIFYGYYTNGTNKGSYRLPLAYFMTGLAVYVYSFVATLRKMAENSRMSKLSSKDDECVFSWKLFTGWDYMIGNAETAHNRTASIILGFKEALLEEAEKKREARNWRVIGLRVMVNLLIVCLLGGSAYAVILVVKRSTQPHVATLWRRNEITVVMSLISFIFPIFFELLGILEYYHPRKQLRLQLARIMVLNLLNLYSLIFALFDKISKMTVRLEQLKGNSTTELPATPLAMTTALKMEQTTERIIPTDPEVDTTFYTPSSTTEINDIDKYFEDEFSTKFEDFNITATNAYSYCYEVEVPCSTTNTEVNNTLLSILVLNMITATVLPTLGTANLTFADNSLINVTTNVTSVNLNDVTELTTLSSTEGFQETLLYDDDYFENEDYLQDASFRNDRNVTFDLNGFNDTYSLNNSNINYIFEVLPVLLNNLNISSNNSMDVEDLNLVLEDISLNLHLNLSEMYKILLSNLTTSNNSCFETYCDNVTEPTTNYDSNTDSTKTDSTRNLYKDTTKISIFNELTSKIDVTDMFGMSSPSLDIVTALTTFTGTVLAMNASTKTKVVLEKSELKDLCWETMFGQELVKLTVMDLIMTVIATLMVDFFRALFVRYMNNCWCWDLEKQFPQYGDFKIAENILHLVNNQGMVWMGMFFSPGLAILNLVKLAIMMYLRSWAVLTCNVPHEVVFRASRSNNFYLALLLTMLFLCVLPVGYAIVWVAPSWHCGPFSDYDRIYHLFTETLHQVVPSYLHKPLDYIASPGIVIPLLVLLVLIIYYLVSLTGSLREANQDLKVQLRRERTEERRKMFRLTQAVENSADAEGGGAGISMKWRQALTYKQNDANGADGEEQNNDRKEFLARIMKQAFLKSGTSEDDSAMPRISADDETDTDQHESLPHENQPEKVAEKPIKKFASFRKSVGIAVHASKSTKTDEKLQHIDNLVNEKTEKHKSEVTNRKNGGKNGKVRDRKNSAELQKIEPKKSKVREDSMSSIWSDNVPVITISKTESAECILEKLEQKSSPKSGTLCPENNTEEYKSLVQKAEPQKPRITELFRKATDKLEDVSPTKSTRALMKEAKKWKQQTSADLPNEEAEERGSGGTGCSVSNESTQLSTENTKTESSGDYKE